jgi:glycine/D-amino acid oxidase-like deaminating enzyme
MADMISKADVVIIGGGVMGSSVAYFLKNDPDFSGDVVIVERDPTYRYATSSLSASSIRQQFSTPLNIELSLFGIDFLRHVATHLACDGDAPTIGLREPGYLILATAEKLDLLKRNVELQCQHGADIACLDPEAMRTRFPWIAVDGAAGGGFGVSGEGWFDGPALMQAFRRKALSLGARQIHGDVVAIEHDGRRAHAVRLADGRRIVCGTLVNAAGPQAGAVARLAEIDLPVRPRKRSVFVFRTHAVLPRFPLLIDTNGVWCRPEGDSFVCGVSPPEDRDPDAVDFEIEHDQFDDPVWPTIAHRVPALETLKLVGGWAGHYEYNTFDQNAVIGRHPTMSNFIFINGFSGHGIQQSPAAGRAVAECIVHGAYRSIDVRAFAFDRILANTPIRELNVI